MKISLINDKNDPDRYVLPGNLAYTENSIELTTGGLATCTALMVLQGKRNLMCHVFDHWNDKSQSTNPNAVADFIRTKFLPPFSLLYVTGYTRNNSQDTLKIVRDIGILLDAKCIHIGQAPEGSKVSTTHMIQYTSQFFSLSERCTTPTHDLLGPIVPKSYPTQR